MRGLPKVFCQPVPVLAQVDEPFEPHRLRHRNHGVAGEQADHEVFQGHLD